MILNFPDNPQQGDQYTGDNGVTYVFDGTKWRGRIPSTTVGSNSISNNGYVVQVDINGNLVIPVGKDIIDANGDPVNVPYELKHGSATVSLTTSGVLVLADGSNIYNDAANLRIDTMSSFQVNAYTESVPQSWTFGLDGRLTIPGEIAANQGITLTTDRGSILFGNQPEPGMASHFHIMKESPNIVDLFFGDDFNYMSLPSSGGINVKTYNTSTDSAFYWTFSNETGIFYGPDDGTLLISSLQGPSTSDFNVRAGSVNSITGFQITGITEGSPTNVTVTYTGTSEIYTGEKIFIEGIITTTQLNDNYYYVVYGGNHQVILYQDSELNTIVSPAGLTPYNTVSVATGTNVNIASTVMVVIDKTQDPDIVNITSIQSCVVTGGNIIGSTTVVSIQDETPQPGFVQFELLQAVDNGSVMTFVQTIPGGGSITQLPVGKDLVLHGGPGGDKGNVILDSGHQVILLVNNNTVALHNDRLEFDNEFYIGKANFHTISAGESSTIYISKRPYVRTMKLVIQAEGRGNNYPDNNWQTQSCEMMVATRDSPSGVWSTAVSVYGLVYTSATPLATFDAFVNTSTNLVEIVAQNITTGSIYTNVMSIEMLGYE